MRNASSQAIYVKVGGCLRAKRSLECRVSIAADVAVRRSLTMALAFLRRYQRDVMLKALLAVIIVGFVLVYIPPFLQGNTASRGDEVGRVGDLGIPAAEYQRIYVRQRSQYERMYRGKVDANMLKSMG